MNFSASSLKVSNKAGKEVIGGVTVVFKRTEEKHCGSKVPPKQSRASTEGEELVVCRQTQTDSENIKIKLAFSQ